MQSENRHQNTESPEKLVLHLFCPNRTNTTRLARFEQYVTTRLSKGVPGNGDKTVPVVRAPKRTCAQPITNRFLPPLLFVLLNVCPSLTKLPKGKLVLLFS